ncbi:MAG: DUF2184 domain-containing protein [Alphaproteobacteria bacterium]|nr:DUF2184 domain-containing protein [Alphaproteobacteria bacterium]
MSALDSTLSYYIGQTELFNPKFNEPLMDFTASRDIKYIDAGLGIEATSYLKNTFGATGSQSAQGLPWFAGNGNIIPGISVEGQKITTPFRPLARNLTYSFIELERSQQTGQPLDTAKMLALNALYRLDLDKVVYLGDKSSYATFTGLVNNPNVNTADVALNAAGTSTLWVNKTPDEIVADINDALVAAWQTSGLQFPPNKVLLPPSQFAYICAQKVSNAGNISILNYIKINCISANLIGSLDIQPLKFLTPGTAYSASFSKARMVVYTNDESYVRFPLCPIQGRQATTPDGVNFIRPYVYGFGEVEFPYVETFAYRDGI